MDKLEKKEKEVAEEYLSSLVDLNVNSKPLINMLTILAEENIEHGQIIVDAVEQHISKIDAEYKLPVLYLIDSIVKNVGREYAALFSHSIVNIFCGVFEKVNEKVRSKMFALRQTWNDVFPPQKLYTLDVKVNCMDSGWPITAKVTPSIHVNPNFFKNKPENELQAQLRDKQRELLELQKRKLELEVAATKKHIEEQEKQLNKISSKSSNEIASAKIETNSSAVSRPQTSNIPITSNQTVVAPTVIGTSTAISPPLRTRIAPVNQVLISSVRLRDPRIARQLQNQLAANQRQRPIDDRNTSTTTSSIYAPNAIPQMNIADSTTKLNNKNMANSKDGVSKEISSTTKDDRIRMSKGLAKTSNKPNSNSGGGSSNNTFDRPAVASTKSLSKSHDRASKSSGSLLEKSPSKDRKHRKEPSKIAPYRSSSSSSDRRKKSSDHHSSLSPSKERSTAKDDQKSSKTSPSKIFKEIKMSSKHRNYIRKNRESSKSPPPLSTSKDLDMRSMLSKITKPSISPIPPDPPAFQQDSRSIPSTVTKSLNDVKVEPKYEKTELDIKLKEKLSVDMAKASSMQTSSIDSMSSFDQKLKLEPKQEIKDVDLRSTGSVHKTISTSNILPSTSIQTVIPSTITSTMPKALDSIKRLSTDKSLDEPIPKKSKSENLDELFGKEDVDLRTQLNPALKAIHAPTPPPPPQISAASVESNAGWATIKSEVPKQSNSSLDAVRAKLAEATRAKDFLPPSLSLRNKDIDLRVRPVIPPTNTDETSQEGNEAKFKIIMSQAQEQLYNENLNLEDYNTLMRQVMHLRTMQKRESVKRKHQSFTEMLTPVSDEEVDFSTSGSETDTKSASRNSMKRDRATDSAIAKAADSTTDGLKTSSKGKRQRKSKWSPQTPWESQTMFGIGQQQQQSVDQGLLPTSNFVAPIVAASSTQQQMMPPNAWSATAQMPFATPMGINQMPGNIPSNNGMVPNALQLLAQQQHQKLINLSSAPEASVMPKSDRTISIDGIPREIRFYDEVAIAFMNETGREPKEIGFQMGDRRVVFDNKDSIVLAFNDVYKPCLIDGKTYHIRFGSPLRELYINNQWYECFFGGAPSQLTLDGVIRMVAVDGPPPQVRIGSLRTDLVVGKVDLYIDATVKISLYLDAQVQTFELANQVHTIQFADYLLTVLIDNQPFILEYGGMPKKFRIGNHDRFIRFSVLPNDIVPGMVYIKNMKRTDYHRGIASPPPIVIADVVPPPAVIPPTSVTSVSEISQVSSVLTTLVSGAMSIPTDGGINSIASMAQMPSPTTAVNTISSTLALPTPPATTTAAAAVEASVPQPIPAVQPIDINDLFQKLISSGILNTAKTTIEAKPKEKFKPITLKQPENWKQRQPALIHVLFSGMQCSSCGVRFPPEHSMKYSQHLDWHFRQNRRDRDSARRAHSRRWYYDVADWIQYEEIEDLDDREKNWFESQQAAMSPSNEDSTQRNESPLPSCIAGPDDVDKTCDMCHDQFETFFNEETEEWHLRNALRIEEKTYHPICYEDYKASLRAEESRISETDISADDNAVDIHLDETGKSDGEKIILDDDDDVDDVIVVPQEEPIVTEIHDDDDDDESPKTRNPTTVDDSATPKEYESTETAKVETAADTTTPEIETEKEEPLTTISQEKEKSVDTVEKEPMADQYEPVGNESDIQILVPQISVLDLDEFEEKPVDESALDESIQLPIKIKEEPKDDGYEDDDGFEEVGGTFESEIISESIIDDEYDSQPAIATHQTGLVSNLDGNIQLQDTAPAIATNKIRINITKNVTKNVNNSSENTSKNMESSSSKIDDSQERQQQPSQSTENIEFEYKSSMRDVGFRKVPPVKNGLDTSGLCSIM